MAENVVDNVFDNSPNCTAAGVDPDALLGPQYVVFVDLIAIVGLLGNICCFLLMSSKELRHLSYSVFLRVLPVTDSIVLVFTAAEDTMDHGFDVFGAFTSKKAGFQVWSTVLSIARMSSPWLVACLTFNRLALILYSPSLRPFTSSRAAVISCGVVLMTSMLLSVPWDSFLVVDPASYIRWTAAVMVLFDSLLPCLIIFILNVIIGVVLRRSLTVQAEETGVSHQKKKKVSRYTISIIAISLLVLVCLFPKTVVEVLELLLFWYSEEDGPHGRVAYSLCTISKYWPMLNCLMLVNFAMAFYVLSMNSHLRHTFFRHVMACRRKSEGYVPPEETAELIEREDRGIGLAPIIGFEVDPIPG